MNMAFTVCLQVAEVAAEATAAAVLLSYTSPQAATSLSISSEALMNRAMSCAFLSLVPEHVIEPPPAPAPPPPPVRMVYRVVDIDAVTSAWEPERDGLRCKALMMEILRRAAHDWVLYRQHKTLMKQELAEDAYLWLFKEDSDHALHRERAAAELRTEEGEMLKGARLITSFLSICEHLDLDPNTVRERVKTMTVSAITGSGRKPEARWPKREPADFVAHDVSVAMNIDAVYDDPNFVTQYESYGSIATPSSL